MHRAPAAPAACAQHTFGEIIVPKGAKHNFCLSGFWNIFSSLYLSFSQRMLCFDVSITQITLALRGVGCAEPHWKQEKLSSAALEEEGEQPREWDVIGKKGKRA